MLSSCVAQQATALSMDPNWEEQIERNLSELNNARNDSSKVDLLLYISILNSINQNPDKSIGYCLEALKICNNSNIDKRLKAKVFTHLALNYTEIFDFIGALENYLLALEIEKERGDKERIAKVLSNIGLVYMSISEQTNILELSKNSRYISPIKDINLDRSIKYSLESSILFSELMDFKKLHFCYRNISQAYILKDDYKKALEFHEEYSNALETYLELKHREEFGVLSNQKYEDREIEQEKSEKLILYFSIGIVALILVIVFLIYRLRKKEM